MNIENYDKIKEFLEEYLKEYKYEILLGLIIIGVIIYKIYKYLNELIHISPKNKVILITQYYEPKNEERKVEIKDCLINNSKNKLIDEIHLFVEKDYDFSFVNLDKIKLIYTDKQLSFKRSFDYSNDNFDNQHIIILANSDIYFNNTLVKIHDLNYDKIFYALSRHDLDINCNFKLIPTTFKSQDVWIWKTPIRVIRNKINETDFFEKNDGIVLGIGSCDNRIVKIMKETGYNVKNIGNKIHCIHNHKNNYRTWMTNPIQKKMQKKYVENGTEKLPIEK